MAACAGQPRQCAAGSSEAAALRQVGAMRGDPRHGFQLGVIPLSYPTALETAMRNGQLPVTLSRHPLDVIASPDLPSPLSGVRPRDLKRSFTRSQHTLGELRNDIGSKDRTLPNYYCAVFGASGCLFPLWHLAADLLCVCSLNNNV